MLLVVADLWAWQRWMGAKESAVSRGRAPVAIHGDQVLVVLEDFRDGARLVPLGGVSSSLVLHQYPVSSGEGWEVLDMLVPPVLA